MITTPSATLSQFLQQQLSNHGVANPSVLSVPRVPEAETLGLPPTVQNTPPNVDGVTGVPENLQPRDSGTHQYTDDATDAKVVFPSTLAENMASKGIGTPRTHGTPKNGITIDLAALQLEFAERAAIAEHDGGLSKDTAEQQGLYHILTLIAEGFIA